MQRWQRHTDPLLVPYNVPALSAQQEEQFWAYWTGKPATILLAGECDGRFVAHILLRDHRAQERSAELGIAMDPAFIEMGIGTQLLRLTREYALETLGIERITLEVAGWNRRALRAYEKAGFVETERVWNAWDTPVDFRAILADPQNEWLREYVRIDTGYTIVLVRMCAQKTRSL
ncbi:MAG: hypothetical protein NVS9B12_00020 [Vulcanimicrobiaceae bacterium]